MKTVEMLNFASSCPKSELVNIFPITLHNHNYWPYCQTTRKQSGCCGCIILLFNSYGMGHAVKPLANKVHVVAVSLLFNAYGMDHVRIFF